MKNNRDVKATGWRGRGTEKREECRRRAREMYETDEVRVALRGWVERCEGGAWVAARLWVPDPDADEECDNE